jgi:DNA-binding NtrC family response regulator
LDVDVRVLAASNRNLKAEIADGRFRDDLFYRLAVVEIVMPALKELGPDDISRLADHFVRRM